MTTQQSGGAPGGGLIRFFQGIGLFFVQVRSEMRKVTWPTRENLKTYTIVVLVSAVFLCLLLGLFDTVLGYLLKMFIQLSLGSAPPPTP